ncbi:hypothetical protein K2173_023835 [Erythroxylum novogranatense]|uniref:Uncharacterized protein n=1 Tax=Erythroxylum novogranatense TaxID=1862640 RepID=A0AAV8TIK5_9ROSI|nr:hypothetical protein K2173_023835 [Erythroxylum novogranatense]
MLEDLNMADCKGVPTPMSSTTDFANASIDDTIDATLFRRVIGKLHYLSFTRPDIAFAVNKLSQFMHKPSAYHWKATKRVLRYLQQTSHLGIRIARDGNRQLLAYSDSDWAGDPNDRTSTTGFIVYLGSTPISWSSKKQRSVSRSSTEAEYRAVAAAVSEINWIQNLLSELHFFLP